MEWLKMKHLHLEESDLAGKGCQNESKSSMNITAQLRLVA
jgi:hypothetical protein